ncbi:hypothetical protein L873DRAFT_1816193 [Choiromyces venosus 120613-1]|uniref:Nephrocystin 3-like N-terminal domain-containing protein n=1 Tax=Choiromyces venosus 120613-1 TaxID=1336337 RepID=A0A3N4J9E6_9PEZI|nr:hypothetical protein L873DRAFT_1816193 [Choiromyces venosus 120613-1]
MAEATYTRSVTMGDNNTIGSFNNTLNQTFNLSDEDAQIMRWISPLEPQHRHQGVRNDRFDGVGDWLLETKKFREWRTRSSEGTDEAVLFCFGNPGAGKTYLR